MDYTTIIGTVGAGFILLGFLLNQTGKITARSRFYEGLNVVGSSLLVIYAILLNSVPFLILNAVWLLVSVRGFIKGKR